MEALRNKAEEIIDHSGDLIETYYQLMLVKATEKGSKLVAESISVITVCLLATLAFLFVSIGFAYWIGEVLQNMKAGFLITAAVFLILILLILVLRRNVLFPYFRNFIIRKLYE